MFNEEEIREWENSVDSEKLEKFHGHHKIYFDPCIERLYKRQKCFYKGWFHCKESKFNTKLVQRKFRTRMKKLLVIEDYHNPVPHEYKTYGWETW